jgi:hypothetical protein
VIRELFGRLSGAEEKSRRAVLALGVGVVAYVAGTIAAGFVGGGLAELGLVGVAGFAGELLYWAMSRLWLFMVLPALAYLLVRLVRTNGVQFGVVSACAGEVFSVMFLTARDGFEALTYDVVQLSIRVLTFAVGVGLTVWAATQAEKALARVDAQAKVAAEARSQEYAEMLARAEAGPGGKDAAPADKSGDAPTHPSSP